jgi:hypothetical protein
MDTSCKPGAFLDLCAPRRQAVEQREAGERDWGEALRAVAAGLRGGRRLLWDDVGRRVGVLLAAPAAWEGEHFLQARQGRVGLTLSWAWPLHHHSGVFSVCSNALAYLL